MPIAASPPPNERNAMTTPASLQFLNPTGLSTPNGYSHTALVTGPVQFIFISGQIGIDQHGKFAEDFTTQARQAFENLKCALAAHGACFANIVRVTNYVVDIGANMPLLRQVRAEYVNQAAPPTDTTLGVAG